MPIQSWRRAQTASCKSFALIPSSFSIFPTPYSLGPLRGRLRSFSRPAGLYFSVSLNTAAGEHYFDGFENDHNVHKECVIVDVGDVVAQFHLGRSMVFTVNLCETSYARLHF
jgi:hypothetical protein